jgi:gamma-glutamyl-gamma-aminobutyrate hydrolase PuuD
MKPRIGITSGSTGVPVAEGVLQSHYVGQGYTRSILAAGGIPIILAAVAGFEDQMADDVLDLLDGLVLSGGTDIDPEMYGSEANPQWAQGSDRARDNFERSLLVRARERQMPVLGICRGFQMINVTYGGTLDQHRPHESDDLAPVEGLRVQKTHVTVGEDTQTFEMLGRSSLDVYCLHHQAIDVLGKGLQVSARAADGMVEALEDSEARFIVGLLWHPEQMVDHESALLPYQALVKAAMVRAV